MVKFVRLIFVPHLPLLLKMVDYLYFFAELVAFIFTIIQYKKFEQTIYAYFFPYLLLIILYEAGSILNIFNINHSNAWITNIIITIEYLFYSFFLIALLDKN